MAKDIQDTNDNKINSLVKGLNKDSNVSFVGEGIWTHARNAVNNTVEGDTSTLSNEGSNVLCNESGKLLPGVARHIIGIIHLFSDKWIVFTVSYNAADLPVGSEIGLLDEDLCIYRIIVQDPCLNFSKYALITGAARQKEDCSWGIYWADGSNPDRYMNVGDPKLWPDPHDWTWQGSGSPSTINWYTNGSQQMLWPGVQWVQKCYPTIGNCNICTPDNNLDCNAIRLARLVNTPCITVSLAEEGGTLQNGSYYVQVAYSIKTNRVTNYFSPSNVQPIYSPRDREGSLLIKIEADQTHFDEFELVIVRIIDEQASIKQFGYFSTRLNEIYIDQIPETLVAVPALSLREQNPVFEKSDQMTDVNNYLLRVGPTSKYDFNYQPLANLIKSEWYSIEYPEQYYSNGGSNTSYLRDEVYCFFIRWVYDTGDKSASYHIPGRAAVGFRIPGTSNVLNERALYSDTDSLPGDTRVFETFNTATVTATPINTYLPDGGKVIAYGEMGYWESSLKYPDNKNIVWNSTDNCWTGVQKPANPALLSPYDLCGQPIRHHKFPDNELSPHFRTDPGVNNTIRIMGVQFSNIIFPKNQDGSDVPDITGYEILRGTRKGNKTVLAKGMLNNFKDYNILGSAAGSGKIGLYANHPFNCIIPMGNSSNSADHDYLYNDPFIKKVDNNDNVLNQNVPNELITFTSPDTSFRNPNLSVTELKLYGYLKGIANTRFIQPDKHPTNKLVSDLALFYASIAGIIDAILSMGGKKAINYPTGSYMGQHAIAQDQSLTLTPVLYSGSSGTLSTVNTNQNTNNAAGTAVGTDAAQLQIDMGLAISGGDFLLDSLAGTNTFGDLFIANNNSALLADATYNPMIYDRELSGYNQLPLPLRILGNAQQFLYYFSEGASLAMDVIYAALPYRQYALQLVAHGFYSIFYKPIPGQPRRFRVEDGFYIFDSMQDIPEYLDPTGNPIRYTINNLKRTKTAIIRTSAASTGNTLTGPSLLLNSTYVGIDESQATIGMLNDAGYSIDFDRKIAHEVDLIIASHYAGLKYRIRNQYGLINTVIQLPITNCEFKFEYANLLWSTVSSTCNYQVQQRQVPSTGVLFKGDTYITRFTEKNTMLFFYNWLYDLPNGTEYNYFLYQMLPQTRYWMNSSKYDISAVNFSPASIISYFTNPSFGTGFLPTDYYNLDNVRYNRQDDTISFPGYPPAFGTGVKESVFYLASSGVRDFFVESDVITDFRNPGTFDYQRPFIPRRFTDLAFLFNIDPNRITQGNYYAYDYSLSINNMFNQFTTYAAIQDTTYDPTIASLCYVHNPNRIIYSLPQDNESSEDAWFLYLPLNYALYKSNVNSVKAFARTGMFITFKNDSPIIYQGVDQLQLESGTKVTIGDGGLFNQTPQNIVISENSYEYGSSQNKYGIISTPAGLYYISQNQGKIFTYSDGLQEISQTGMQWWFTMFLPYKLIDKFPDYPHTDNPVAGIGCQAIYDNRNSIVYFSKRDFNVNPLYDNKDFVYDVNKDQFTYLNVPIKLGQAPYFQDASWTISYDPKNRYWVSFHDWHPSLTFASKNVFLSVKNNGIWKHDASYTDYCNFYGQAYPFELEIPVVGGQTVSTMRSVEYILECYKRSDFNPIDQFQVLDFNFDQAVVYNAEQTSGYLNLNIFPKNNITLSLQYPKLNGNLNSFDILFSKEEQKYRFNQFWDITRDRGEFPIGSSYPPQGPLVPGTTRLLGNYTELIAWETQQNGYIKQLNQNNLDYNKDSMQRKKFRHYTNLLFLRKDPVIDQEERKINMIIKLINTKNQISLR
jgi:hypothetical protein